ncbi:hypothetical protein ACFL1G_01650 [Planctomycetota bacterium]
MRFLALLKKELRECLSWMLLAAIAFLVIGGFVLQATFDVRFWNYQRFTPGSTVGSYTLTKHPPLSLCGIWLLLISIGLGLALGIRQFWMPNFTKTWGLTLHRSVSRQTILWGKVSAAAISFIISVSIVWLAFYRYSSRPGLLPVPPIIRFFIEGLVFVVLGFVAYLGTALVGLSTAKWYTTKIFGLAFAALILATTLLQYRLIAAFAVMFIGSLILLSQIIYSFLNREF